METRGQQDQQQKKEDRQAREDSALDEYIRVKHLWSLAATVPAVANVGNTVSAEITTAMATAPKKNQRLSE